MHVGKFFVDLKRMENSVKSKADGVFSRLANAHRRNLFFLRPITMDFKDQIKQLGDRIIKLREQIATEEATKNAFIMPMLQILGYDVFNPLEIVPEFTCDIGNKKNEKIDYAVVRDGVPLILIECKHWKQNLDNHDMQLLRYYTVSKAKFGVLTNGVKYRMFTDLIAPNKMDDKPFFEFDLTDMKENQVEELKKFHKSYFDLENIVSTASDLKYTNEIMALIRNEIANPSEWFVRGIAKIVYPSNVTPKIFEQFVQLTKKSFSQVISDMITERLKTALTKESEVVQSQPIDEKPVVESTEDSRIVTTEEELEGFYVVKAALRGRVDLNRVTFRDTISYFGILLDDNNRKPICRLYFNTPKKFIAVFDENKKEIKSELPTMDDIFKYAEAMVKSIENYDNPQTLKTHTSPINVESPLNEGSV